MGSSDISWCRIGLGLNSLNIQFDTPTSEYIILTTDLTVSRVDTSNFSHINSITSTTHIAGVTAPIQLGRLRLRRCRQFIASNSWATNSIRTAVRRFTGIVSCVIFPQRQVNVSEFPNEDVRETAMLLVRPITMTAVCFE